MQVQRKVIDVTEQRLVIELPESFLNRRVELIVLTVDDEPVSVTKRRRPHPDIAGKGRTLGNLLEPVVAEDEWDCLK